MRAKKGIVKSNIQDKTLVVTVHRYVTHPKYKKKFRVSKNFHVHNPENTKFEIGTEVEFFETKPISKTKKWSLIKPEAKTIKETK